MHCLMSSEEWHRKIPFTGYLLAISISVPVVDLESVRRVASGAQNIVFLAGCVSVTVVANVCRATWIVGLNGNRHAW